MTRLPNKPRPTHLSRLEPIFGHREAETRALEDV